MKNFQSMGLPEALNHTLQHMQFKDPTPIQAEAIPLALEGKDILGSAQTGTGKTGAFGIPLVAKLMNDPHSAALVITPTRELASQVMNQLKTMLGSHSTIKHALLIGGESILKQFQQLRQRPRPGGRVCHCQPKQVEDRGQLRGILQADGEQRH